MKPIRGLVFAFAILLCLVAVGLCAAQAAEQLSR